MKQAILIFFIFIAFIISGATAMAEPIYGNYQQMLINNEHKLSDEFMPESMLRLNQYMSARDTVKLQKEAAIAASIMIAKMKADGVTDIYGQSGFRSYDLQVLLNQKKVSYLHYLGFNWAEAESLASQQVAIAGSSEHQSGLAIDFTTSKYYGKLLENFAATDAGKWLAQNSWKYGYILRYSQDKSAITGYIYEPWHFRYVGIHMAEYLYENDLCMEEFFAILEKDNFVLYKSTDGNDYVIALYQKNKSQSYSGKIISFSKAYADSATEYIVIARLPKYQLLSVNNMLIGEKELSFISINNESEKNPQNEQWKYWLQPKTYQI